MTIVRLRLLNALAGALLFVLVWRRYAEYVGPFFRSFAGIVLDALPYLTIGALVSSLLEAYVPDARIRRLAPKNKLYGVLFGSLLGTVMPLCECGMVPIVRRLIRKGVPAYIGLVYLAAGPVLNPIVAASTFAAFRSDPQLAYARFGLAFAVAATLGLTLAVTLRRSPLREDRFAGSAPVRDDHGHHHGHDHSRHHSHDHEHDRGHDHSHDHEHGHGHGQDHGRLHDHGHDHGRPHRNDHGRERRASGPASRSARLGDVSAHALQDLWSMGKYLLAGSLLAAAVQTSVSPETISRLAGHDWFSHLFMMAFAFLLSLCSTADAFVAAPLAPYVPSGALLSFLVLGPMLDLKGVLLMLSVFRKRFVLQFSLAVFGLVLLGSHLFEQWGWAG